MLLKGFTNIDPRASKRALADEALGQAAQFALALLRAEFADAEFDLEYSVEGDEGAPLDDFMLSVVAYTSEGRRLERVRDAARRWAESCANHDRIVLNAHHSGLAV